MFQNPGELWRIRPSGPHIDSRSDHFGDGRIFLDIEHIQGGADFGRVINVPVRIQA